MSYRKAIELKPDFTDAHLNLGNILKDLGQMQELILLLKETLELKSINKGYKLRASLLITIANLLQGDYAETFLNLNKTLELANEGAIILLRMKKVKNIHLIFKIYNSLYPRLRKRINILIQKKFHILEKVIALLLRIKFYLDHQK